MPNHANPCAVRWTDLPEIMVDCSDVAGTRTHHGPMDMGHALETAVALRRDRFVMITLTHIVSGEMLDIERFLDGNPRRTQ